MIRVLIKASSRFPINRKKIRQAAASVLKKNGVKGEIEVSISIVGDRKMKILNKEYLKREGTVSILSFPLENTTEDLGLGFADSPDGVLRLGDIVVSYPQVIKQAVKESIFIDKEIESLIKHGMKNLLGIQN